VRRSVQLSLGLLRSTMLHDTPLDFIWLGVMLERTGQTARVLDVHHHVLSPAASRHQVVETALWLSLLRTCSGFEPFMLTMKIGALAGLMLSVPFILYQLWLFIAPGLYSHEKRMAAPFVIFCTTFFALGAAFSHFVAFPWTWKFFLGWQTEYMEFRPSIGEAFGLYVKMLLGFGLIFQMPTIVYFLARLGLVSAGFLLRHTKYAVLIIFIIAAVISPGTDVVSQCLMAGPMLALYGLSIVVAWAFAKPRSTE